MSRLYPTRKIHEYLKHVKNMFYSIQFLYMNKFSVDCRRDNELKQSY